VSGNIFVVDLFLCNTLLINAQGGQQSFGPLVYLCATVADDANDYLLPRILAPCLAVGPGVHELYVFYDANHGSRKELVLLVVHCDDYEKLGGPWLGEEPLTEGKTLSAELRRIAGGGRISHVGEFVSFGGLSVRHLIEQPGRDGTVENQVTVEQLDFFDRLPSSDHGRRARRRGGFIEWIGPMPVVSLQHRPGVCFVLPIVRIRVLRRRLIRLAVVGIMVFLWINSVFARPRRIITLVLIVVAVRVVETLNGELYYVSAYALHERDG
jgi:hypothetical protein